jgi:hypothetical protein
LPKILPPEKCFRDHPPWYSDAAIDAIDVFEEGDYTTGGAGDFDALRIWLSAHMMWDPRLDQKQLDAKT